jgi:hypothetical protein
VILLDVAGAAVKLEALVGDSLATSPKKILAIETSFTVSKLMGSFLTYRSWLYSSAAL